MTKIKLCGLSRPCDIEAANALRPDYIGFVFAPKSRRYVTEKQAAALKKRLHPAIRAVGVFVDENPENIAALLKVGVIDAAQLHGSEDEAYLTRLRSFTDQPIIQAFKIRTEADAARAAKSGADYILLDSGSGSGTLMDWRLIRNVERPYFLAGGLSPENVREAIAALHPYALDVSSGIETGGVKDQNKMEAFVDAVRSACGKEQIV